MDCSLTMYFGFPMSVLLQQSSVLIFILNYTFIRRTYVKKPENFLTNRSAFFISGKVKYVLEQATKATLSLTSALDETGWLKRQPGRFTLGMTRYPFYRRLGGPKGQSGWVRKILLPLVFDPRTVQPIASRYTDWAVPAHISGVYWTEKYFHIVSQTTKSESDAWSHLYCGIQQVSVAVDCNDKHPPLDLLQEWHLLQRSHFVQWDYVAGFSAVLDVMPVHLYSRQYTASKWHHFVARMSSYHTLHYGTIRVWVIVPPYLTNACEFPILLNNKPHNNFYTWTNMLAGRLEKCLLKEYIYIYIYIYIYTHTQTHTHTFSILFYYVVVTSYALCKNCMNWEHIKLNLHTRSPYFHSSYRDNKNVA